MGLLEDGGIEVTMVRCVVISSVVKARWQRAVARKPAEGQGKGVVGDWQMRRVENCVSRFRLSDGVGAVSFSAVERAEHLLDSSIDESLVKDGENSAWSNAATRKSTSASTEKLCTKVTKGEAAAIFQGVATLAYEARQAEEACSNEDEVYSRLTRYKIVVPRTLPHLKST